MSSGASLVGDSRKVSEQASASGLQIQVNAHEHGTYGYAGFGREKLHGSQESGIATIPAIRGLCS